MRILLISMLFGINGFSLYVGNGEFKLNISNIKKIVTQCEKREGIRTVSGRSVLCIIGDIQEGDGAVKTLNLNHKIKVIVANTLGGDAETAIDIADLMLDRNISLIVDGVCGSSCANYLFFAASEKHVTKGSLVLWHGAPARTEASALEGMTIDEVARVRIYKNKLLTKQKELFKKMHVPEALIESPPQALLKSDLYQTLLDKKADGVWAWTIGPRFLKSFYGITGLNDYWYADPEMMYEMGQNRNKNWVVIATPEPDE